MRDARAQLRPAAEQLRFGCDLALCMHVGKYVSAGQLPEAGVQGPRPRTTGLFAPYAFVSARAASAIFTGFGCIGEI
jgi:hypothetical protein